jgi:parallel beta-helix repeat protein
MFAPTVYDGWQSLVQLHIELSSINQIRLLNSYRIGRRRMHKTVSGIMLTLLMLNMLTLAFNIQPVKASGTIYIRADGSIDPPSAPIQRDGDLYTFTDNIYDSIVVQISNIIVDGAGYTLQGPGSGWGFYLYGINNVTIKGTNVKGFDWGISLSIGASYNTILGNNITSNFGGVHLSWSSGNVLKNNSMINNDYNFMVVGYALSHFVQDVDTSNTVDGKPIYYWVSCENIEVPSDAGYVALVNSTNITVKGLRLKNNGQGILLAYTTNAQITNNNLTNNWHGIALLYSSNNSIYSNDITNNSWCGVWLEHSSDNRLYHNNLINNTSQVYFSVGPSINTWDNGYPSGGNYWSDYTGMDSDGDGVGDTPYIIDADNQDRYPLMHPWSSLPIHNINTGLGYATIQEAINANEPQDGHTIYVEAGTYYEHVTINKSIALVGEDRTKTIIDGNGNGTVVLVIANNTMISGFTIRESGEIFDCSWNDVWCGIMVGGYETPFDNVTIMNNHIRNNYIGVLLWSSINSKIIDNNIENNTYGIIPFGVFRSDISHNNLSNGSFGINAQYVLQSNISNNTITSNEIAGLRMQDSSFNTIDGNYIENNWYGIDLSESDNNNITRNTLTSNEYGISLGRSGSNLIYHNNFIWNSIQVYNSLSNNTWNDLYPSGGNYWSDYTGVDVKSGPGQDLHGSDSIGDVPYIIDADNVDHYPLMNPYGAPLPLTYALTITTTVGGTTDPALGTYSYTANSSVQVTAIPNADYAFDHWELDTVAINVYMGTSYDPNYTGGLLVTSIVPGGPVDKAGLTVGDVIRQVDNLQVNRAEDLMIYVERYKNPGDTVVLKINRNNLIIQITLMLERAPVGSPNPYTVLMDNNHTLKAVFTYSPPPPQLTASISPLSASILVGQSVTFTSTVSGGYTPYSYQWHLNGNPVSGATSNTWAFTPTTSGIYYIYLKVTDAKANTAQSDTARITVASIPVGGYSFPIQVQTKTEPVLPYIALIATLTAILTKLRPKTKRKR